MAAKIVRSGRAAGASLARGVDLAADLVSATIGPSGRAVLVGRSHAGCLLVRNGYAVLQQVELEDSERQMGLQAMRELAWRTSDQVGDGTSTAILMARALMRSGAAAAAAGVASTAKLQAAVDAHLRVILAELESSGVPAPTEAQLARVTAQAAGGDLVIGELIADAHHRTGTDGYVLVEEGTGLADETRFDSGLHFGQGWISPHFVDDERTQSVEIEDPLILLHLGPLTELGPIVSILEMMARANRGLVIIAENVSGEALTTLVVNKQRAGFKVAAVKAPGTGLWRPIMLEDIAIATGGTIIAEHLGTRLEHFRPHMVGRAEKVRITRTGTTIVGGLGDPAAIEARVREIRDAVSREKHLSYDRDQHRRRLAWLAGGIATVRMGGATPTEVAERQNRAKCASAALRAARAGGVLPGGSSALIHVELRARAALSKDTTGRQVGKMYAAALRAPLRAITNNAGADGNSVVARAAEQANGHCYDAVSRSFIPSDGICDPLPVVRAALVNSVSVANRLLDIGASIAQRRR